MATDWGSLKPTYYNDRPLWNPYTDYLVASGFESVSKDDVIAAYNQYDPSAKDPKWKDKYSGEAQWAKYEAMARAGQYAGDYNPGRWEAYDSTDYSEANLKKLESIYSTAVGLTYGGKGRVVGQELFGLATVGWDLHNVRNAYNNQKMQGALADIETGKLKRKQFEQMRKIASEGNEEASEDQRPTGKASVLIGSNIPDRKQKRTSHSREAGTARAKVKVQAKGINI